MISPYPSPPPSASGSHLTIFVRQIIASETAAIRHAVLWPSVPLSSQLLPFDSFSTTIHYGAFLYPPSQTTTSTPDLIGCLTITNEPYPHPEQLQLAHEPSQHRQLHKFAVLPEYQGQGVGRTLLLEAVRLLRALVREDGVLLHFDARETQIGFYAKLGFEVLVEERFVKRGPTGDGPAVVYVRMGKVLD